ncbi:MAG TPA: polysaccharide biosynthesis/export family protein [Bryobacteraceae bacterium]|jgi:polysaccharide export outer membrane protein|nr:polysaccharide biosynthesis/export family protein [Bryobacteraceae bacterium]
MIRSNLTRLSLPVGLSIFLGLSSAALAQETPVAPPTMPQTQPNTQQPAVNNPNPARPAGAAEPVNSSSYKIGAADVLNVQVWGEARFSGPATVQENGTITLPLVGQLKAGGMTPNEVEKEITDALAKYVRQPLVTVTVAQVGSKQYYMDGGINRAGKYPLVVPTTILEAISEAGGLQPFANAKKIYVLRGTKRIPFNYKDVIKGKHMEQNILLEPGDHVIVPN